MQQFNDLYGEIGRVLTPDDSALALPALRQDPLVWESLGQADFLRAAVAQSQRLGSPAADWNPGRLALLALGEDCPADDLRAEPLASLGLALQERALQAYQAAQRAGRAPSSLGEAALLALALRERRRLTGTWGGLLQEIAPSTGAPKPKTGSIRQVSLEPGALFAVWRTALACLYGLVPDPEEMLRALLPKSFSQLPFEWIAHIQLCQPVSAEEHAGVFSRLLSGLPAQHQLGLLRSLNLHGQERLAETLAGRLVVGHPAFAGLRSQIYANELDLVGLSSRALSLQQMGAFYQLAGDRDQALALFDAAEVTLNQWLAGLYLQRLDLQVGEKAGDASLLVESDKLDRLAGAVGWLNNSLGAVLLSHPCAGRVLDRVPGEEEGPFLQIKRARQMFQSDPAIARDLARQSVAGLLEEIRRQGIPFGGDFVYDWCPEDVLAILLTMGLFEEAARLAQALLAIRPADLSLLNQASRIQERLGNLEQAIAYASGLAALIPGGPGGRRLLGELWGQAGGWEQALSEWQSVLALSDRPAVADRLGCAHAALMAGRADLAAQLSEAVLQEEPNNGVALGLLGRALVARGENAQAAAYLVRATLLAPEILASWLALARVQAEQGEPRRALETLRAAVTAVPDDPAGHLALGEACASGGLLAEALPHFKRAYLLSGESAQATLLYGRTLRKLGHLNEARAALEKARAAWADCPELAYEYAQVLLDLNDAEGALPVLETALRDGLPVLEASLLYARILAGEYRSGDEPWDAETLNARLNQASQALRNILDAAPDNVEARFLMADILREKGELEEALAAYRELAELPSSGDPDLHWRIQWGLGRTALELGQSEIALVSLKEACQVRPDSLPLQRTLAEASLDANLIQEALDAAANVLRLAPDDVSTLSWFADFAARAGEPEQAVEALERAVQLDPERADLLVSLASGQARAGDLSAARASLEKVLSLSAGVGREDLRRAAHVYLRLEDPQSALACYGRALQAETEPPTALLLEVAQLRQRMGEDETALDLIQQAIGDGRPGVPGQQILPVYLLQADLLAHLNRTQAALAVLERALRVAQAGLEVEEDAPQGEQNLAAIRTVGEIHDRFTRLMILSGDLPAALHHAEKSQACDPHSAALTYRAADLALAQLQNDRAARTVQSFQVGEGALPAALIEQGRDGLDLLSLMVEMALDGELEGDATAWIEAGLGAFPGDLRLLASKARLLARQGDLAAAGQLFTGIYQGASTRVALWLAEAALDAQCWKEAIALFERCAAQAGGEARAHLALARGLTLCAERQQLCESAGCRVHTPGAVALSEERRREFEEALRAAGRLAIPGEIERWQARGQAVFGPSAQAARTLASLPSHPQDVAALVAALRRLGNRAAAVQVARREADHPLILLHLALCYQGDPSAEALAVARKAVEAAIRSTAVAAIGPLAQAAAAMLARQAGELGEALEGYEAALRAWPDEPGWHEAAGDLCMQAGSFEEGMSHYQQALALDPENAGFAFKLGQSSLSQEDIPGAIACLEKSAALDPAQPGVWLTLASAYQLAGRLPQALEAARKAGELDSASAEALLVAGETALSMNQAGQALEFAQGAVRREPENAGAVLFLSGVLVLTGRVEEGLEVIEQSSPAVRASFRVAFERARLICRMHGAQAGLEILEKLAKDHPEEHELLGFLARTQAECGDLNSAERTAFRALRLEPNQPDLTLMLGRLNRKNGHLDQAVHLLGEVIRMTPDALEAYLELGSVYQERREFAQAQQIYRQAMQIAPADYRSYYQSGLILRDSKDYAGAETALRRAAELVPNNAGQAALSIRRQLVAVIALNLVHNQQEVDNA